MANSLRMYDNTGPDFLKWCVDFCKRYPRYAHQVAAPQMWHIIGAIHAEGFDEINAQNIEQVKAALEARAAAKATA